MCHILCLAERIKKIKENGKDKEGLLKIIINLGLPGLGISPFFSYMASSFG